jgi:DNA-binding transcriptional ArsR family regulator
MVATNRFAEAAALMGDPARAAMLIALMDGRALTAGELARAAGVAPQTASGHLAKMGEAGLLGVARQGRHRYHRLASAEVAAAVESLMRLAAVSAPAVRPVRTGPADAALRLARTCYDHLAGRLGIAIADGLQARGALLMHEDAGTLTPAGAELLAAAGIDLGAAPARGGRAAVPCRPCLDWSERRFHVAGRVGAAICAHGLAAGWIRRIEGTRAVAITPAGRLAFADRLGVRLDPPSG